MNHNVNALVEMYDAGVGSSTLYRDSRGWKELHHKFLVDAIASIFAYAEADNGATLFWRQFEELIETRGFPQEKGDFRRRRGIFEVIPDRVDIAVERFDNYMGDESKLENWQKLCRDLSFDPIPPSISQCRKAVQTVYINIYTFLDGVEAGQPPPPIHRFESLKALAMWSKKKKKFFPRGVAKEEGALRGLLRPIVVGRKNGKNKKGKIGGNADGLADAMGGLQL